MIQLIQDFASMLVAVLVPAAAVFLAVPDTRRNVFISAGLLVALSLTCLCTVFAVLYRLLPANAGLSAVWVVLSAMLLLFLARVWRARFIALRDPRS